MSQTPDAEEALLEVFVVVVDRCPKEKWLLMEGKKGKKSVRKDTREVGKRF